MPLDVEINRSVEVIAKRLAKGKQRQSVIATLGKTTRHSEADWRAFWKLNEGLINARTEEIKATLKSAAKREESVVFIDPRLERLEHPRESDGETSPSARPRKRAKLDSAMAAAGPSESLVVRPSESEPNANLQELTNRCTIQQAKIKSLTAKLDTAKAMNDKLQNQLEAKEIVIGRKEQERKAAQSECTSAFETIQALQRAATTSDALVTELRKSKNQSEAAVKTLAEKNRILEQQHTAQERRIAEIEAKHKLDLTQAKSSTSLNSGKESTYIATLESMLQMNNSSTIAQELFEKAYAQHENGELLPAIASYSDALFNCTAADERLQARILSRRAEAQFETGDEGRRRMLRQDLDTILSQNPAYIDALVLYSLVENADKQHAAAIQRLDDILQLPFLSAHFKRYLDTLKKNVTDDVRAAKRAAEQASIDARVQERKQRDAAEQAEREADFQKKQQAEDSVWASVQHLSDYEILNLPTYPRPTPEAVKRAQRTARIKYHPDKCGGSHKAFQRVDEAAANILNPTRQPPPPATHPNNYRPSFNTGYQYNAYGQHYDSYL